MNENKKGVRANKRKVASLEPSKPRNFVAKNAINSGAGAHKDKKKAMKQGDTKHKKLDYAESLELRLNQKLKENKLDEFLPALVGAALGAELVGGAEAGTVARAVGMGAGRVGGNMASDALNGKETDEEFNGEYDDEAGMAHGNLHTIARAAQGLIKEIEENDNLPEWCQEKIAVSKSMIVTVWDYIISEKEQGIDPKVSEGGYSRYDDNRTRGFAKREREPEYHTPDPVEPQYNIKVNGEVINRQPFANRAEAVAWAKQAVAAGKLDPKTATLSPINKEGASISTTPGSIDPGGAVDNFKQQMANNTEIAYQKKQQGMAEGNSGAKYKVKSIGRDSKGDYYISPNTGKKVYKQAQVGDHEVPGTGEIKKKVAEGSKKRGEEGSCKKIGEDYDIEEGVNDPHIFKCIFLFGPMGAGKSTVARPLLSHTGLRSVNLDNFNELFIKKGQVPTGHLSPDQLEKSWQLSQTQQNNFIDNRLGVIIDGSGRNPDTAISVIEKMMPLGYEFMMIFVNVSEETSIARQQARADAQQKKWGVGRQVDPTLAKNTYAQVQKMLGRYSAYFGQHRFVYIDNENTPDLTQATKKVDAFLRDPVKQPEALEWIKAQKGGQQVAQQQQKLTKQLDRQQQSRTKFMKNPFRPAGVKQSMAEADEGAVDINQLAAQMKFLPTRKKILKYKFIPSGQRMTPLSYRLSDQDGELVKTITSTDTADNPETKNVALKGDVVMSGPSGENYVVKAAKFGKLYDGNIGGIVYPEQSPRMVAMYTGQRPVTFTAPWGESMKLEPGDYLVKDGDAGYYRIAKAEYKQTYNEPGSTGQQGVAEDDDPWGPQGRYVGDTGPKNISTEVPNVQLQIGDTVVYKPTEQRATIENLSKDGKQARIHVASPMGGKYFNCRVSDLKAVGRGVAEGAKVDRQAQHITKSMMKAHPGMSHDQAEAAAWAHIKHPKKKKKKVAEGIGYGSKVQHPKYGSGQVIKVYPNGMITVNFSGYPDPVSKKPGVQSNFMPGDASYNSLRMEGWTTDTLAAQLFEQEITYEDKLNSMLTKKLSK